MAQQTIGIGSAANDGTGDPLRTAFTKSNGNFTELYNGLGGVIAKSGAAAAHTGDTTETTLATVAVPANAIGANGFVRITSVWTMTSSANNKFPRIKLAGTSISTLAMTTETYIKMEALIFAANATNSQNSVCFSERGTDQLISGGTGVVASAADMTSAQNITFTGQLALGSETITLLGYVVEFIQ